MAAASVTRTASIAMLRSITASDWLVMKSPL
jgi:hypothetical protein